MRLAGGWPAVARAPFSLPPGLPGGATSTGSAGMSSTATAGLEPVWDPEDLHEADLDALLRDALPELPAGVPAC